MKEVQDDLLNAASICYIAAERSANPQQKANTQRLEAEIQRIAAELSGAADDALPGVTISKKTPAQEAAEQKLSDLLNNAHSIVHKAARLSPNEPFIQLTAEDIDKHVMEAKRLFGLPDDLVRISKAAIAPKPPVVQEQDNKPQLDEMYEGNLLFH